MNPFTYILSSSPCSRNHAKPEADIEADIMDNMSSFTNTPSGFPANP